MLERDLLLPGLSVIIAAEVVGAAESLSGELDRRGGLGDCELLEAPVVEDALMRAHAVEAEDGVGRVQVEFGLVDDE